MKVRVGSKYKFNASMWDRLDPNPRHPAEDDIVTVVNLHGCPPANTMGCCYVNDLQGNFRGMVNTNSLTPVRR